MSDWGNIGRLVKLHTSQSSPHHDAVIKGDNYLSIASGKRKDICSHLSSQVTATIERNRRILKAMLDVIVLCGQQSIALRGHVERTSNFHSLLQFRAKRLTLFLHFTYKTMTTEQSTLHQGFRTNLLNFVETTPANLW